MPLPKKVKIKDPVTGEIMKILKQVKLFKK